MLCATTNASARALNVCVCVLFWQEATWHFDIKPLRLGRLRARIGY